VICASPTPAAAAKTSPTTAVAIVLRGKRCRPGTGLPSLVDCAYTRAVAGPRRNLRRAPRDARSALQFAEIRKAADARPRRLGLRRQRHRDLERARERVGNQ
jgi:hypothetical protein